MPTVSLRFDGRENPFHGLVLAMLIVVGVLACSDLAGWLWNVPLLKSFPVLPLATKTMKANTAIGLLLLAIASGLARVTPVPRWRAGLILALTIFTSLIAFLTISEYLLDLNLGIDEFLFPDPDGFTGNFPPGRLAPITAISFISIALSIILTLNNERESTRFSQILAFTVFLTAFQALFGFIIGYRSLFGTAYYTQMALYTSICLLALSSSVILLRPYAGIVEMFRVPGPTGTVLRRLLMAILFIPPLIYGFAQGAFRAGWYDHDFVTLFEVVGNIALFAIVLTTSASALFRTERERLAIASRESQAIANASRSQALQHTTETQLNLIINSLPALISYVDLNERYVFANGAYRTWFGLAPENIIGQPLAMIIGHQNRDRVITQIREAINFGKVQQYEGHLLLPNDGEICYRAIYIPDFDSEGFVRGCIVMGTNVTSERKHDDRLRGIENRLRSTTRDRDRLVSERDELAGLVSALRSQLRTPDPTSH